MSSIARLIRRLVSDQHGQDIVEYGGALLIVSVIIAGVAGLAMQTLGPAMARDIECLVEKILGHGCTAPPAYPVSASVKAVGYAGRVAIVDGGHSYTITLTKLSNGTSTVTAIDNGKLGVSAQWGADAELGPLGGAGADASLGGGIYGEQTSTWTFPTWAHGQQAFNQISQGSSLGLTVHDAVSGSLGQLPGVGHLATGLFDRITGASGAPGQSSLPHKYLTSTSTGGGLQGSGAAGAHADFGPLQAGVNAALKASGGLRHINSGPEKGDWQLVAGLAGTADGDLANWLFGAQAGGAGTVTGEVSVTFSPSGAPEKLEVTASGDKEWGVSPPSTARVDVPGSPSSEGGKGPVLSVASNTAGGSGDGSVFTGTLALSTNPRARTEVTSILEGDTSSIGDLINQLNTRGIETIQTYHIARSNSRVGGSVSAGAGFGATLSDGTSSATYDPPRTREDGGKWHNAP